MSHLILSQSISTFVKEFSGKPPQFRDWVRQVEKYVQLNQLPTEKAKFVAYQTATGVVSDFIGIVEGFITKKLQLGKEA